MEIRKVTTLPVSSVGNANRHQPIVTSKAEAYSTARQKAAALVAAKAKCRKLIDLKLAKNPDDATLLAQAMLEVGAAASRYLSDPSRTASLLGHLSRRISAGHNIDC